MSIYMKRRWNHSTFNEALIELASKSDASKWKIIKTSQGWWCVIEKLKANEN